MSDHRPGFPGLCQGGSLHQVAAVHYDRRWADASHLGSGTSAGMMSATALLPKKGRRWTRSRSPWLATAHCARRRWAPHTRARRCRRRPGSSCRRAARPFGAWAGDWDTSLRQRSWPDWDRSSLSAIDIYSGLWQSQLQKIRF